MSEINLSEMQTEIESNDRDLCLKTALIGTNLFDHLKKKAVCFKFLHSTLIHTQYSRKKSL